VTKRKPREIAVRVLLRREQGSDYVENLLAPELPGLPPNDRALCQELVFGVVRNQSLLDWLIARKTGDRPQKKVLRALLRLGLYQLFWLNRVPDHAAVNESVSLARELGFGPQSGFLNAVLRGYSREREAIIVEMEQLQKNRPEVGYSHPDWLCRRWGHRWGTDALQTLLAWNNKPPKTYARVNQLRTSAGLLLEKWREEDVDYDFVHRDWLSENHVFELKKHPPLMELESFRAGWFYVQDPGTLLSVLELDPKPGEVILDRCAAPGGKTTLIAEALGGEGRIVAQDRAEDRLDLVEANCKRMGIRNVDLSRSSSVAFPELNVIFDRVLVDAPCSNTGVMRRRVDLRWRIQPGALERLQADQLDLLKSVAPLLRPGGTLVYSTCSLEPEENEQVIERFLGEHPDYSQGSQRLLTPFQDKVDGAFVARLVRDP